MYEKKNYEYVSNPFEPWPGVAYKETPSLPMFEDEEAKSFKLSILNHTNADFEIPVSGFGWLGNRYKAFGQGAEECTGKWWKQLYGFIRKNAVYIPRGNDPLRKKEIYALPDAYAAIRNGRPCRKW